MRIGNTTGLYAMSMPFLAPEGAGGGDAGTGGGGAPAGFGGGASGGGAASGAVAEPSVIDVDDNALIRVKGSDKPVKFGEHVRGFQSQFTKASQEAARLRTQLQQAQQREQQFERERQAAQQRQGGQGQSDVYDSLRQLPYLSGEQAVQVVQGIGEQIKQRDMVLLATLKKMEQMQGILQNLNGAHVSSSFENKVNRWLSDGGYPPEAADLAKEIYLAYEGNDLDQEFPTIFKNRWEQMNRMFESQRQSRITAARKQPFIPGKGGAAGPSRPVQLKGNESAKQIADLAWDNLQANTSDET